MKKLLTGSQACAAAWEIIQSINLSGYAGPRAAGYFRDPGSDMIIVFDNTGPDFYLEEYKTIEQAAADIARIRAALQRKPSPAAYLDRFLNKERTKNGTINKYIRRLMKKGVSYD